MKAEQKQPTPAFIPVILTLESQEEIDKLFALFNYMPISDVLRLTDWYCKLQPFISKNIDELHTQLCDGLKRK